MITFFQAFVYNSEIVWYDLELFVVLLDVPVGLPEALHQLRGVLVLNQLIITKTIQSCSPLRHIINVA